MKKKCWKIIRRLLLIAIMIGIVITVPIVITGYQMYKAAVEELPVISKVEEIKSDESYVAYDEISSTFLSQVVISEDRKFFDHFGINITSTARAFINNLLAGAKVEGGSSITQQLAKNMYFTFEKRYERKVAELFVAFELEKVYSKKEILELYCNIAYFGEGSYGIKEATLHYYGKEPINITDEEAAALVITLKSPNNYNPNALKNK
ncbi:transglycosylase domain-containing protein [Fusibacter bizertensis]